VDRSRIFEKTAELYAGILGLIEKYDERRQALMFDAMRAASREDVDLEDIHELEIRRASEQSHQLLAEFRDNFGWEMQQVLNEYDRRGIEPKIPKRNFYNPTNVLVIQNRVLPELSRMAEELDR
jgi:hypothetical protein